MLPFISSAILLLLTTHAQPILSSNLDAAATPSTCGPTIATVGRVTTITIESIVTLTHSCFTQTLTTKRLAGASGCPTLTNCGVAPQCIITSTKTVKVPPTDACCPTTATSLIPGPCPMCQTGCDISITTAWITEVPSPTPQTNLLDREANVLIRDADEEKRQAACFTTVINSDGAPAGVTATAFPLTVTRTSTLNCRGCEIVTKYLYGFGPGGVATTTVTDAGRTATATAWACA